MDDVDMDIEIDYGEDELDPEILRLNAEVRAADERAEAARAVQTVQDDAMEGVDAAVEEGEVQDSDKQPHKIYFVCEQNMFHAEDIKAYVAAYCDDVNLKSLDWVNDYAVNLVFDSEDTALHALTAMTADPIDDPAQARTGKPHPSSDFSALDINLRQAKVTDVKKRAAAKESRYYLFNPEHDPESRHHGRQRGGRNDRRGRRDDRRGGYRPYNDHDREVDRHRPGRHSRDDAPAAFDESMYDDAPSRDKGRRASVSSVDSAYGRKAVVYEEGRLRDRSSSPMRDGDGRYGFEEDQPRRQTARYRSRSPPRRPVNRSARDDFENDLFANRAKKQSILTNGNSNGRRDGAPIELFPGRVNSSPNHRRKDAQSLLANEVATAIGPDTYRRSSIDSYRPPSRHGDTYRPPSRASDRPAGDQDLFDRITRDNNNPNNYGRLNSDDEINIKGAANGYKFHGQSRSSAKATELFPHKVRRDDEKPRDLMDGIAKNRRRRAEDY